MILLLFRSNFQEKTANISRPFLSEQEVDEMHGKDHNNKFRRIFHNFRLTSLHSKPIKSKETRRLSSEGFRKQEPFSLDSLWQFGLGCCVCVRPSVNPLVRPCVLRDFSPRDRRLWSSAILMSSVSFVPIIAPLVNWTRPLFSWGLKDFWTGCPLGIIYKLVAWKVPKLF